MSVEEKVKKIVSDIFKKDPKTLKNSTDFVKDLHAKSVDMIALIAGLEGEFRVRIPRAEVSQNNTVGKAIAYMKKTVKEK